MYFDSFGIEYIPQELLSKIKSITVVYILREQGQFFYFFYCVLRKQKE